MNRFLIFFAFLVSTLAAPVWGGEIRVVQRKPDPFGSPRPANAAAQVSTRTSLYFELELKDAAPGDRILAESAALSLQADQGEAIPLVGADALFRERAAGWVRPHEKAGLAVYVDPGFTLEVDTRYTVHVAARSREGLELAGPTSTWSFTTESAAREHPVALALDLGARPVHWRGGFFTGICNVVFCTRDENFGDLYRMMTEAQKLHPRAWRYQRDIWMTATDDRKPEWHMFMDPKVPNLVRERETRRIARMEDRPVGVLLHLEDFFGCEQYGVPAGRPLSDDYKPGYEVLVADGVSDARSKVLEADDDARTILLAPLPKPKSPWLLDYQAPPPKEEDPQAPGLFAAGGTHLRRFDPPGTPVYYWGRLDKEWDLAHKTGGRRLVVNFVEAPSDLSLTGREYTRPKDYAQWHEAVRTIAGHLIDRYGEGALDFQWSVFNEPDIVGDYWRRHWDEAQRFYDYTVDGVLRAFEDRGHDSRRVRVGGWELGAIFGTNLRLNEVLAHCSPRADATAPGALLQNAAFTDARLDGKRSRRLEELCGGAGGKGSPCDFLSIHTYNRSDMAAAKLIRAKEMALAVDADFFRELWIDSHESCPSWSPPPDEGAADSYLGNGYFPSWCLDVAQRQLQQAAADERYAFGESVITIWPPPQDFAGVNTLARRLGVDDDGDGGSDASTTVASPIFHALTLLSDFGPDYWPLPARQIAGHTVSGFASRDARGDLRVALFSHHAEDIQSRSEHAFAVTLELNSLGDGPFRVTEHRFDREHNTYFAEAVALRQKAAAVANPQELKRLTQVLEGGDPAAVRAALADLEQLDSATLAAVAPAVLRLFSTLTDAELRESIQALAQRLFAKTAVQPGYSKELVEKIQELANLRLTSAATHSPDGAGTLRLNLKLRSNSASLLLLERAGK
jgi:hypothetical protein